MKQIILIAHNLRSAHNIGSLLRTAEGLGVEKVILTGYTPFPSLAKNDPRLPHEQLKVDKLIQKTALNAQNTQKWSRHDEIGNVLTDLKRRGYTLVAIEQTADAIVLPELITPDKIALLVGREVEGVESEVLKLCDFAVEIPMFGQKESFNVVQAAAMALYHCRFM